MFRWTANLALAAALLGCTGEPIHDDAGALERIEDELDRISVTFSLQGTGDPRLCLFVYAVCAEAATLCLSLEGDPAVAETCASIASTCRSTTETYCSNAGDDGGPAAAPAAQVGSSADAALPAEPDSSTAAPEPDAGAPAPDSAAPPATGESTAAIGFGRKTTGGAGGPVYTVTSLANSGPGSLRAGAEAPGPRIIRFAVNGTIRTNGSIEVTSNKTIDGRGADITITPTVHDDAFDPPSGASNIIFRNLKIIGSGASMTKADGSEARADGIWLVHNTDIWIDHCTISGFGDKQVGMAGGGRITVSWSHLHGPGGHAMLSGCNATDSTDGTARITWHHNWVQGLPDRQPMVRGNGALVHLFNNYIEAWGKGTWGSATRIFNKAQAHIEGNIYRATITNNAVLYTHGGYPDGSVRLVDNLLLGGAVARANNAASVFVPSSHYSYTAAPGNTATRDAVLAGAGWRAPSFW